MRTVLRSIWCLKVICEKLWKVRCRVLMNYLQSSVVVFEESRYLASDCTQRFCTDCESEEYSEYNVSAISDCKSTCSVIFFVV